MHLYAFSSIGGLHIYGKDSKQSDKDILRLKVEKEDLSGLGIAMIQEVGADASPELIAKCRELVRFADEHLKPTGTPGNWTDEQAKFIETCEDLNDESMRPGETHDQYYDRLTRQYG